MNFTGVDIVRSMAILIILLKQILNDWEPKEKYDIILASRHHALNLVFSSKKWAATQSLF